MKTAVSIILLIFAGSNLFSASPFFEPDTGKFDPSSKTFFFSREPYFIDYLANHDYSRTFSELAKAESFYQARLEELSALGFRDVRISALGRKESEAAIFRHGQLMFSSKRYAESLKNFESFLRLYPLSRMAPDALFWKAQNLFYLERFEESYEALDAFLAEEPAADLAEYAMLSKAIGSFHLKNYSRALREISALLSSKPSVPGITQAAYFFAGESWFFRGSFADAEREYRKVIRNSKDDTLANAALFRLAHTLYQQGKNRAARDELEKLLVNLDSDPDTTPKVLYVTAEIYFQEKDYTKSAANYGKIIADYPQSYLASLARYSLAWCYMNSGDFKKSGSEFGRFYRDYPEHELAESSLYLSAIAPYAAGDYAKASQELKKYYNERKKSVYRDDALYYLAWCRLKELDFDRALGNFRIITSRFPESNLFQEAEFMICETLKEMQEYDFARKNYLDFISKYPSSGLADDAFAGIAECHYGKSDFGQAEEWLKNMLKKYPQSIHRAYANYLLARISVLVDDFDKARSGFDSVVKQFPASPYAALSRLQREITYYRQKRYAVAAERLVELINIRGMEDYYDEIHYYVGLSKFKSGDYKGSIESFQKLFEHQKNSKLKPEAALRIGDVHFKNGNFDAAIAAYKYMLNKFKDSELAPFGLYGWSESLRLMGQEGEAVSVIEILVERYPKSAVAEDCNQKIARYYIEKSEYDRAVVFLRKIITDFPLSRQAPMALTQIGDIETMRGNYGTAENIYRQVIKEYSRPEHASKAHFKIANNLYRLGRNQNAVKESLNIVTVYPKEGAASYALELLFNIYTEQQDAAKAESAGEKLLKSFPQTLPTARVFLAYGKKFFEEGKYDAAASKFSRSVEAMQGDISAEAQKMLGDTYFAKGDFHQATVEYLRTVYLFPESHQWSAESQYMAGISSEKENQMQEASRAYNRVLQYYGTTQWSDKARERLDLIRKAR